MMVRCARHRANLERSTGNGAAVGLAFSTIDAERISPLLHFHKQKRNRGSERARAEIGVVRGHHYSLSEGGCVRLACVYGHTKYENGSTVQALLDAREHMNGTPIENSPRAFTGRHDVCLRKIDAQTLPSTLSTTSASFRVCKNGMRGKPPWKIDENGVLLIRFLDLAKTLIFLRALHMPGPRKRDGNLLSTPTVLTAWMSPHSPPTADPSVAGHRAG